MQLLTFGLWTRRRIVSTGARADAPQRDRVGPPTSNDATTGYPGHPYEVVVQWARREMLHQVHKVVGPTVMHSGVDHVWCLKCMAIRSASRHSGSPPIWSQPPLSAFSVPGNAGTVSSRVAEER